MAVWLDFDLSNSLVSNLLDAKPENSQALVAGPVEIYIPLSGMLDLQEQRKRWRRNWPVIQLQIDRLEILLGSDFANKAPVQVVQRTREAGGVPGYGRKLRTQLQE